jgi:outer membrane protein TolC
MREKKSRSLRLCATLATVVVAVSAVTPVLARCNEDGSVDTTPEALAARPPINDGIGPRGVLYGMVREALGRSQAIGAAKLLADAAASDVLEQRAQWLPQASFNATIGPAYTTADGLPDAKGLQVRGSLNMSAPIYDGGRINRLTDWRAQLAEAARLGQIGTQEQVALQTVSLALERSRYRLQAQVYDQYAKKMSCLVDSLQKIVSTDPGRASELVQARKTVKQAELARVQTISTARQLEVRLRRFVGDGLPSTDGLTSVLLDLPALDRFQSEADNASEIGQLSAQAKAADSYAQSIVASQKPQVSWALSAIKAQATGGGNTGGASSSLGAGVSVSVPLLNPGTDHAIDAARARAQAARLQVADALEARRFRMAEVYEQATASFQRAKDVVDVLRDSEKVRSATLMQWQQAGRRSLFDVMAAESDHYNLRVAYLNALYDGEQAGALLRSLGVGLELWLQ